MAKTERDEPPVRLANGRFATGHRQLGHRRKGQPNRTTKFIRDALIAGPAIVGDAKGEGDLTGFCAEAARELAERKDRAAYLPVLSKLVPPRKPNKSDEPDDSGENPHLTINVINVPEGWQQLPDGITYAPWDTAEKIWREHRAKLAAAPPAPGGKPLLRILGPTTPGDDDSGPPAAA